MKNKKVLVGLSGGVDSSLTAALLIEQGYDVTGVYLKAWDEALGLDAPASCPWEDDIVDARRVAAFLGIPFSVIDVKDAYYNKVVSFLKSEYAAGRTPNPDILCNREMKFGIMLQVARELGFDYIATGHYARVQARQLKIKNEKLKNKESLRDDYSLLRGKDNKKDQTYFLWTLTQDDLKMTLFPLGELTKDKVRIEALKRKLPVATKKDSQGICFLGPINLRDFLKRELKTKKGNVLNEQGKIIGEHLGAAVYTIGQRHGFTVFGDSGTVYYIVSKNTKKNELIVSKNSPTSNKFKADQLNFINKELPKGIVHNLEIRIRHGQNPLKATLKIDSKNIAHITTIKPVEAVAPGQSVVFSNKDIVLGGGVII